MVDDGGGDDADNHACADDESDDGAESNSHEFGADGDGTDNGVVGGDA